MPWITHMLFMGLNDIFSCQEFDRLLCNCSVKCGWVNTMRKTTVAYVAYVTSRHHFTHRCLVTPFPATRMDKTEALHMPRLIVVFPSVYALILALEKGSEVERRDKRGRWRISFVSEAAKSCSPQNGLTQNLTLSNILAVNCSVLRVKNYF